MVFLSSPAEAAGLDIEETESAFRIESGAYGWTISKTRFDVLAEAHANGELKIEGGEASADFLGSVSTFGPPSEFMKGEDWVELRGHADPSKNLWYVARYRFFEDQPFLHLALSLMDRHEGFTTEGPWDDYWQDRMLRDFTVNLRTTSYLEGRYFRQSSSFAGREVGVDADIVIQQNEGSPFHWRRDVSLDEIEIYHRVSTNPDRASGQSNAITWIPGIEGEAQLVALLTPYGGSYDYKAAYDVAYEVQHADGVARLLLDQTKDELDLGSYTLDRDSAVSLFTESSSDQEGMVRARALRVIPKGGEPFEIAFQRLADDVLKDSGYALGVVDLWQHHPIELYSAERELAVSAIAEPARWSGGIGLTLDLAVILDADQSETAMAMIKAPPAKRDLPDWWSPFDGSLAANAAYDQLASEAYPTIAGFDDFDDNYGWRGYGDYQISTSYSIDGKGYQNWGGLQYDLTSGLLFAWMRTGDERLWQRARAAVRHQMDVAMAKFEPFAPKRSGHLYRKGECPVDELITCQEPIPDFGYGYRAFLLWHHLTGEEWAKELARQQIEALAYFGARSGGTTRSITDWLLENGSRPLGWIVRAQVTGRNVFPEGTRAFDNAREGVSFENGLTYDQLLKELLDALVPHINGGPGHYPSDQPVWSGQGIEALAMAYLEADGAFRSEGLKQAVLASCEDLVASMEIDFGNVDFVYVRDGDQILEWSDQPNYGLLWLDSLTACAEIAGQPSFKEAADALFDAAVNDFRAREGVPTREWSSLLSFGGYFREKSAD